MTSVKLSAVYEDHLTYPILVKMGGGYHIKEMAGASINAHNEQLKPKMTYQVRLKNERLHTIAQECGLIVATDNSVATQAEIEFFAEQIVREAARFLQIGYELGVLEKEPEKISFFLLDYFKVSE